jgi:hypothetical protein
VALETTRTAPVSLFTQALTFGEGGGSTAAAVAIPAHSTATVAAAAATPMRERIHRPRMGVSSGVEVVDMPAPFLWTGQIPAP